ncbi:PPOX class F420-dependent oxidoreductase [Streptomyces sp. NPDC001118]
MTDTEWRAFLRTGTRTAKLATNRRDGRPHVTPVWFLLDDARPTAPRVLFTTWHESLKAKALRRDPRFSLCVDDQEPPFGYVMLECTAAFSEDPAELRDWATRIAARYMGPDQAGAYGLRNSVPGEYLVLATIDNVIARHGISD